MSDVGEGLEEVEPEVNFSYGLSNSPDPKRRKKAKADEDDQDEKLEESSYDPMLEGVGDEPDEDDERVTKKRYQKPQKSPRSSASDEGKLSFFGAGKRRKKHDSDDEKLKSPSPSYGSSGSD